MDAKTKALYSLTVEVKLHCAATLCVNNIGEICNLKGVGIDSAGKCSGMITFKPEDKKDNNK